LNIYIFYSSNNDLFMSWINFKRYCSLTFVWFFKTKIQVIKVFLVKLDFKFLITSYINTKSNKSISTFFIEKFPWNPHSSIIIFFFFILSCIFHKKHFGKNENDFIFLSVLYQQNSLNNNLHKLFMQYFLIMGFYQPYNKLNIFLDKDEI